MIAIFMVIGMIGAAAAATYDSSVTLDNKMECSETGSCAPTPNDVVGAVVEYNANADMFEWHASGNVSVAGAEYDLIYYADPWEGNNPGAYIATIQTESSGAFDKMGEVNLNMDLPCEPDANYNSGAKIWMVLRDDYDETNAKMTAWNSDSYLFEMNMAHYNDCDRDANSPSYPANATVDVGVSFGGSVPITISNASNVGSVQMAVTYNSSLVNVTNVSDSSMDTLTVTYGDGFVKILTNQMGSQGLSGDFTLANLTFDTVGEESCDFDIVMTSFQDASPCVRAMPYVTSSGVYCAYTNGDVNGDGAVNAGDVMYLAKHIITTGGFENIVECASDVDGDGSITVNDVVYLARHLIDYPGYEILM